MSQVLDQPTGDAGKTYTLASWLPSIRVSGNARPHTTLAEDGITAFLASYTLVALFWDGLRHNNLTGVDNFFSPPHIAMYLGLIGLGVWIAIVLLRYQKGLDQLDWSAVPLGGPGVRPVRAACTSYAVEPRLPGPVGWALAHDPDAGDGGPRDRWGEHDQRGWPGRMGVAALGVGL